MRAPSRTHKRAKHLRGDMSLPEVLLWARLRHRQPGIPPCRRQHPVGPYVLDFYFSEAKLCIEVDGYSHGTADRPERDVRRDAWLRTQGVKVMRYPASVVLKDPGGVAASILDAVRDGWDPDAP